MSLPVRHRGSQLEPWSRVDEDAVEASLDEGVLTLRVPKAAGERPRRISIN